MARRKDHSPEELTDMATQRVLACLEHTSASNLSLRSIARDIGYSPGTLINHFGSFSLLLLAANARTLDDLYKALHSAMQTAAAQRSGLKVIASTYLAFARQRPNAWRLLFELRLADDEPLPAWQEQRISALFTLLEQELLKLKPNARALDCQRAARVLWAGVQGICQLTLENKLFPPAGMGGDSEILIDSLLTHYLSSWMEAE